MNALAKHLMAIHDSALLTCQSSFVKRSAFAIVVVAINSFALAVADDLNWLNRRSIDSLGAIAVDDAAVMLTFYLLASVIMDLHRLRVDHAVPLDDMKLGDIPYSLSA